jgi:ribosomal-protein-alanine N-acetyltransferase
MRASTLGGTLPSSTAMEIRLARCTLRPWRSGDEPALARHANNRKVWLNLRDAFPHPYTRADADAWVAASAGVKPVLNLAIEAGGEVVGSVGMSPFTDVYRRSAEIGYWLAEPLWGRGIMTEALGAATEHAFGVLEVVRIQAAVFEWNPASMRVLEKCGYRLEGRLAKSVWKDGTLMDSVLYAKLRG